ncbi:MAG: F0F1 ATP synthase subunit A [Phycisphaerales bacterium]
MFEPSATTFLASGSNPLGHVVDKYFLGSPVPLSAIMVVVAGFVTVFFLLRAAKAIATGPESLGATRYVARTRLGQLVECIIVYLRDQALEPILGKANTRRYMPILLTIFFFILTMNLFGMVPFADLQHFLDEAFRLKEKLHIDTDAEFIFLGGTATASIFVTGGLALISLVLIFAHSFRELGVAGTFEHLCGGPELVRGPKGLLLVVPIIFIIELSGMFIKPAALAIRLFANMVGGHTLMATLLMFGGMALQGGLSIGAAFGISFVSGAFAVCISFLELFVAFLQAFIFMFLTAVFMGAMSHAEEHGHGDAHTEHGHDHAGGHGQPAAAGAHH